MSFSTTRNFSSWLLLLPTILLGAVQASAKPSSIIDLSITKKQKNFAVGSSIPLTVRVINKSKRQLEGDFNSPITRFYITKSNDVTLKPGADDSLWNQASHRFVPVKLKFRQSTSSQIYMSDYVVFKKTGTYLVRYALLIDYWDAKSSSSTAQNGGNVVKRGSLTIIIT